VSAGGPQAATRHGLTFQHPSLDFDLGRSGLRKMYLSGRKAHRLSEVDHRSCRGNAEVSADTCGQKNAMHTPSDHLHGKEGVDGSSPSEGFRKTLQMGGFLTPLVADLDDASRTRSHCRPWPIGSCLTPSLARRGLSCARRAPFKAAGTTDPVAEPAERVCTAPALPAGRARIYASAGPRLTQRRFRLWLLHPGETAASPSRA
jgi:hypothetical protein